VEDLPPLTEDAAPVPTFAEAKLPPETTAPRSIPKGIPLPEPVAPPPPQEEVSPPATPVMTAAMPVSHLTDEQIEAIVSKVFRQVIERIAWEVVPEMAETIIKEELLRLTQEP
jgi:hypothetical protein